MRKQILLAITLFLMGVSSLAGSSARAEDVQTNPTSKQEYGTAGCGLGSMLFHDKPGIVQVLAATTNGTSANQTFAITTGTSNCDNTKSSPQAAKAFIQANREAVSKDLARGSGETISSLSTLAGCADPRAVGATLQREFKTIFPNEKVSDVQVSDSVVGTLQAHPELACRSLS
jgi:hypothetical protein